MEKNLKIAIQNFNSKFSDFVLLVVKNPNFSRICHSLFTVYSVLVGQGIYGLITEILLSVTEALVSVCARGLAAP